MTIEDIILQYSQRGMDVLSRYVPDGFCASAAKKIYALGRKNILLTTGFYVEGYAETDGPPGTFFLAKTLKKLEFSPVILTDSFCKDFFTDEEIPVVYLEKGFDREKILSEYEPVALISIERCGENINGDYANMRGVSIAEYTADIDKLFEFALEKGIYTIGIGDGGNEIGMGNLKDVISAELSLVPCKTEVSDLIIATVSNWGAYAIAAELSVLEKKNIFATYDEIYGYIEYIVSKGSVDGVKKAHTPTVDGYEKQIEKEIIDSINQYINENIQQSHTQTYISGDKNENKNSF